MRRHLQDLWSSKIAPAAPMNYLVLYSTCCCCDSHHVHFQHLLVGLAHSALDGWQAQPLVRLKPAAAMQEEGVNLV
jgi:hypothetical protein